MTVASLNYSDARSECRLLNVSGGRFALTFRSEMEDRRV